MLSLVGAAIGWLMNLIFLPVVIVAYCFLGIISLATSAIDTAIQLADYATSKEPKDKKGGPSGS